MSNFLNKCRVCLAAAILFILSACETDLNEVPRDETPLALSYGAAAPPDFAGMMHSAAATYTRYTFLNELGVQWVHLSSHWDSIQPEEHYWREGLNDAQVLFAQKMGKNMFSSFNYAPGWLPHSGKEDYVAEADLPYLVEYARRIVRRYDGYHGYGKIHAWCIWNEPDTERFWKGTRKEFYALVKAVIKGIREQDAELAVELGVPGYHTTIVAGRLTAGVSDEWLEGLFDSGAVDDADFISYHPYTSSAEKAASLVQNFKNRVRPYGFADRVWITEFGFPTRGTSGNAVMENAMPENVVKSFTLFAALGVHHLMWYHFDDDTLDSEDADSEHWFGLLDSAGGRRKTGYWAYALCAAHIPGKTYRRFDTAGSDIPASVQTHYFEGADGKCLLVLWNSSAADTAGARVKLPEAGSGFLRHDTRDATTVSADDEGTAFAAGSEAVFDLGKNGAPAAPSLVFLTWTVPSPQNQGES
ncbi:MAG: hypothetical protein LBR16_06575 [Treponema sp.]|nr:hypothetical protein [Treponema sp.]